MNPTPQQIAAIRSFVGGLSGGWTNTVAQVRAAMAAATVANPETTAPTVAKPFIADDLVAAVSVANQVNVVTLATTMPNFLVDVDNQDKSRLQRWARLLKALGKLTAADLTALAAVVNATQADPAWTATLPWDVATLGRAVDDFDILAAKGNS